MFYHRRPMTTPRGDVDAAVAGLRARWGAAAPRVIGALALADPATAPEPRPTPSPDDRIIRTGFAALDAILGPGGLPRSASVGVKGDGSSGRTTLALRVAAEAQAQGSVVAWLDLSRSFDPVEAVARGVRLEWLVVITPASLDEGLGIAGSLLAGRSVDMLVIDLPGGRLARTDRPARIADRLHRLAALARRAETLLLILDAPGLGGLSTAVAESTGIRLELARRSWVRLGRDVVGQRTEALVAHNRHGPPGRRAVLRILYADGGERDACLMRDDLLLDALDTPASHLPPNEAPDRKTSHHATSPPLRATPVPGPGTGPTLRALPDRPPRAGRHAVGPGSRRRCRLGGTGDGRPSGDATLERAPTRP
jgi:recombination protein RecA